MASPRSRGATGPHSAAFVSWCTLLSYPRGPSKHYGRGSVVLVRSRKSPRSTHPSNLASPAHSQLPCAAPGKPQTLDPTPHTRPGVESDFFCQDGVLLPMLPAIFADLYTRLSRGYAQLARHPPPFSAQAAPGRKSLGPLLPAAKA
jgi:hypothetical protein